MVQSLFKSFPRNQLATKEQSFSRNPLTPRFHMNSRVQLKFPTPNAWGSNSPPPTLGARVRRSWLRPTAEDMSAFGQHRKFPPHVRKTSQLWNPGYLPPGGL